MDALGHSAERLHLNICDTEFYPDRDGFSAFREAVASAFMPWLMERNSDAEFSARIVSMSTEFGSFARTRMSPLTGFRNKIELSKSPERCLYANYVIAGQLAVEQGDTVTIANKGDLIIYDSTLPVKHIKLGDCPFEDLSFSVPKARIASLDKTFSNITIPNAKIIPPLASCFSFLMRNISSAQPDELGAVGAACASLLPVAVGHVIEAMHDEAFEHGSSYYARELMKLIDAHIGDIGLSPSVAAESLGISVRYVHKQFAMMGTTFSSYVMSKRLELVSRDLVSDTGRQQPIFVLAYRWGFNDLSTFIRAFKKKFGCSPRDYRARF
jgi:AraC family transcriptional regulator, positive regulator of tynA and feaB